MLLIVQGWNKLLLFYNMSITMYKPPDGTTTSLGYHEFEYRRRRWHGGCIIRNSMCLRRTCNWKCCVSFSCCHNIWSLSGRKTFSHTNTCPKIGEAVATVAAAATTAVGMGCTIRLCCRLFNILSSSVMNS
jgi:hypothetical protein